MQFGINLLFELLRHAYPIIVFVIEFIRKEYRIIICVVTILTSEPERHRYTQAMVSVCLDTRRNWNRKLLQTEKVLEVEFN